MNAEQKLCKVCNTVKPLSEFYKRTDSRHYCECKKCENARRAENLRRYRANKPIPEVMPTEPVAPPFNVAKLW